MFHAGTNRAKYDIGQRSSYRAMQRDRDLERQSIAMVEAALSCCMTEEKKAKCSCKHTEPVPAVGDFMPLLLPEEDSFAPYRK